MDKGFLCSACHIQLYSSFLFFFPFGSLLSLSLLKESGCQMGGKNTVRAHKESFCKSLQDYLLLRGPSYMQTIYVLLYQGGLSGHFNSISCCPPLLKLTHLTSVIQLRADLHWPSCCDYICLHGREVFTVETAASPPPTRGSFCYWRKELL